MAILVNISTKQLTGEALQTTVRFSPLSFPSVLGTSILAGPHRDVVTDADGEASILLEPGDYKVQFKQDGAPLYPFTISVESGADDPSNLVDLIVESVLSNDGFNFVIAGGTLYLKNTTTNKYHKPYVVTVQSFDGPVAQVVFDAGVTIAGPDKGPVSRKGTNYRFKNGSTLQLINSTTAEFHTVSISGAIPQMGVGEGEA